MFNKTAWIVLKCWYECGKSCSIYRKTEWKLVNFWIMYNLIVTIHELFERKMLWKLSNGPAGLSRILKYTVVYSFLSGCSLVVQCRGVKIVTGIWISYLNSVLPDVKFSCKILAYLDAWESFIRKRFFQPIQLFVGKRCSSASLTWSVTWKEKRHVSITAYYTSS